MQDIKDWVEVVLTDFWILIVPLVTLGFALTNNRLVLYLSGLMLIAIVVIAVCMRKTTKKCFSDLLSSCLGIVFCAGCSNLILWMVCYAH